MRKSIVLSLVFIFLLSGLCFAGKYAHTLKMKNMDVFWTLKEDKIHFKLSAKTTGWVAIGIDPETVMQGGHIIIGAVKKGKVKIQDHYANKKRGHKKDEKLGGKSHVKNPKGSEKNGTTVIRFTLPLDSGEKWDKPIKVNAPTRVMFAYGTGRDSFSTGHKFRAVYDVNFTTGEAKKIK
ncbi:MAG: DOMON domain-containing protein [Desulfobacterales bacterium]|nr:DOMON domain-containing protein [Desulfobacterales bacterium]